MLKSRVADGESYKRSRHTDAEPHGLAAPVAQPSPPPFPALGLPNVGRFAYVAYKLEKLRSTARSSSLPFAPVHFSQQQLMTALLLQQSALSPTALFEQQTAAAQPVSLQQGSQSFHTLSEQILATKLQIAT